MSFIAFCKYYRAFLLNFAKIKPLENKLKQDNKKFNEKYSIQMGCDCERSFKKSTRTALETSYLSIPNKRRSVCSKYMYQSQPYRRILSQIQKEEERVIAYTSKKLTNSELKYWKELLTVYKFLKQFKHYLLRIDYKIRTEEIGKIQINRSILPVLPNWKFWIFAIEHHLSFTTMLIIWANHNVHNGKFDAQIPENEDHSLMTRKKRFNK